MNLHYLHHLKSVQLPAGKPNHGQPNPANIISEICSRIRNRLFPGIEAACSVILPDQANRTGSPH